LFDASLVQSIGWTLVDSIWQGTVVGGVTALALRAGRGRNARTRYLIACAGLALMLLAPLASFSMNEDADIAAVASVANAAPGIAPDVAIGRLLPMAVAAWMIGVVLLSVRLVAACIGVERMKRATRHVDAAVSRRLHVLAQRLGVTSVVRVFESSIVRVPTVVGCLRPVILLPAAVVTGLPAAHLDAVLAHELAHVRRHDYLVNMLQAVVEILLFYHPAVWWCSRQIRAEREHCCDDLVVEACGDRVGYATALARLEELKGVGPMLSLNASGGRLLDRVRRLLGYPPVGDGRSATWLISAALAVVVAAIVTPAMTSADAGGGPAVRQDDIVLQAPSPPSPSPRAPVPTPRPAPSPMPRPPLPAAPPAPPQTQVSPTAPVPPLPPLAPEVQAIPAPPPPAPPLPPKAEAIPVPPAPPAPPAAEAVAAPPAPPAPLPRSVLPVPPAPPDPPSEIVQIDPEFIANEMRRASEQMAAGFEDLRRATEEINAKQEALRQAQAELTKMRLETLAARTRIEAVRKAVEELSAATSAQPGRLDDATLRKQLETIVKEIEELGAR